MKRKDWSQILLLIVLLFAWINVATASPALTSEHSLVETGHQLFVRDCSGCHGVTARGDGILAAGLKDKPANLTVLSRRHGGQFPETEISRAIDGRDQPRAHLGGDMPLWGERYKRSLASYGERVVQDHLNALIAYLKSLQRE